MIDKSKTYKIRNRSSGLAIYNIPELNIRREFAPGEIKNISYNELEKLTFQPGGRELMEQFLQLIEDEVADDLNIHREPEYNMTEKQVIDLILNDSLDTFLDALDFAPVGVIDLIKSYSVSLPITDIRKRDALFEKTGFNVDKAIANEKAEKAEKAESAAQTTEKTRRVTPQEEAPIQPTRRTSGSAYSASAARPVKK